MSRPRKICVVTGTRAEYGLLQPLMSILQTDPDVEFQLVVTGAHLSEKFGSTIRFIEADGFIPNAKVDLGLSNDSNLAIAHALGKATSQLADAFSNLAPDVVVVLGDRYEILAAAQAALIFGIPIAHIHGGEVTHGAFDDSIRHSLTKMSNLHFVSAPEYKRRVVQLGESPTTVFDVGALGLDVIANSQIISREELTAAVGIELLSPILLATFHSSTRGDNSTSTEIDALLQALEHFDSATVVFTGTNADPDNSIITTRIDRYVRANPKRRVLHDSLGQSRYINLMRISDVVIGNSSSGIIEAPALSVPTVNIGSRQNGRLRATSIIDVPAEHNEIRKAIETALSTPWKESCKTVESLYGRGNTAKNIADTLKSSPLSVHKIFFDTQ